MQLMGQDIPEECLDEAEAGYLSKFIGVDFDLQHIWQLMDDAWDEHGAGCGSGHDNAISAFYASPVWLLNGIFTGYDPESKKHREGIAQWIEDIQPQQVADFGGGYGSLARIIAERCPHSKVRIIEPFPTKLGLHLATRYSNLEYAPQLPTDVDVVIAQDVLEHVSDPLDLFMQLLQATRSGGFVVTANCFYPVIKCHLPATFHFRHTFPPIATLLGCEYVGTVPRAEHALIFRKNNVKPQWARARNRERLSRICFPVLEYRKKLMNQIRSVVRRLCAMINA